MPTKTLPNVKLQSADGEVFEVSMYIAKCSSTIRSMMNDDDSDEDTVEVVFVPYVNASTLRIVLEWANHHKDDDTLENARPTVAICEWDRDLLRVEKNVLMELVLAANNLGIKRPLDITCITVEDLIKESAVRQAANQDDSESEHDDDEEED